MAEHLAGLLATDRVPHALLLHGLPGSGRRRLAEWFARRLLGLPDTPGAPLVHPDSLAVGIEPDRTQISVAQIRTVVGFIGLTASISRKVVIIDPAAALHPSAANALLKTLEEPAGNATLILIVDSPRRLPATIVSRSQRLLVPTPAPEPALAWLAARDPRVDWAAWLGLAGGAPLAAAELRQLDPQDDGGSFLARLPADLAALMGREEGPAAIARRWAKGPVDLALRWLQACVSAIIASRHGLDTPRGILPAALQKAGAGPNIAAWFTYLDRVQLARRQLDRGLNTELQVADLLLFWVGLAAGRRPA